MQSLLFSVQNWRPCKGFPSIDLAGGKTGVITVGTKAKVMRNFFVDKKDIKQIARERQLSRNTVWWYQFVVSAQGKLPPVLLEQEAQLIEDAALPRKQRHNAVRLHQLLVAQGYQGDYDSIQRFVKQWKEKAHLWLGRSQAFIPLEFSPGDAMQFDRSMEHVVIGVFHKRSKSATSGCAIVQSCLL